MTQTRTLRASTPADLLAIVPYLLGFHPHDSVVVLTHGGGGETFHARIDLPDDPADLPAVAEALAEPARRHGVRRVATVVYTDDARVAEAACEVLDEAFSRGGTLLTEALRADGERWFPVGGADGARDRRGTPYDLSTHPLTAQAVLEGQVILGSRRELADSLVGTDPDATEAVTEAITEAVSRLEAAGVRPDGGPASGAARAFLVDEGRWASDRVRRFLADREPLSHDEAGRLIAAIALDAVRDVAWSEMSRLTAAGHVELWRDLVRRCPHDRVAPPAAMLGFAAWLSGDGALAWCAVDRSRASDPDHTMAALVTQVLAAAVPPSRWTSKPAASSELFAD